MKRCTKCSIEKLFGEFYRQPRGKFGVTSICIQCDKAGGKERYLKNRERYNKKCAEWRAANKDRHRRTIYAWVDANRERLREYDRNYKNKRYRESPDFKLNSLIRASLAQSLNGTKRRRRWQSLVGYTLDEARAHLEKQFTKGMTWANMGEWHIDHIVPLSSFNITGPDCPELRAAWALTNLRPLWATANLRKGARRAHLL